MTYPAKLAGPPFPVPVQPKKSAQAARVGDGPGFGIMKLVAELFFFRVLLNMLGGK